MRGDTGALLKIFLFRGPSLGFALAVCLGLALSEAMILTTAGLMDGFEKTLKEGLRRSVGDMSLRSRRGFFSLDAPLEKILRGAGVSEVASVLESEAFCLQDDKAKGVLVRGIETESFKRVVGPEVALAPGNIVIGRELAHFFRVGVGDSLVLSLMGSGQSVGDLPSLASFRVGGILGHGIYQQDLRYVYMDREELQGIMGIQGLVNTALMKSGRKDVAQVVEQLNISLGERFYIRPFWSEFSVLLQAVRVEKFMIGLILQIIVAIAAFNVMAYMIFMGERRAKEIFLFRALGTPLGRIKASWALLVLLLWAISCLLAIVFYRGMKGAIEHLPFLALPGDVYYLSDLKLSLSPASYGWVFSLGLVWMALVTYLGLRRMEKMAPIQGLREKFN